MRSSLRSPAAAHGVVYRARQPGLPIAIALKLLLARPVADPEQVRFLAGQRRSFARLDHSAIVPVYEIEFEAPFLQHAAD